MNALPQSLLAWAVYPGVIWLAALLVLVALVQGAPLPGGGLVRSLSHAATPLAWLAALGCGLAALALLPWPRPDQQAPLAILLVWSLSEACHLLALFGGLSSNDPARNRSAAREAQLTALGRVALWLGALVAWQSAGFSAARIAGIVAALVALPLALQWPPWGHARAWPHAEEYAASQRATALFLALLRTALPLATLVTLCLTLPSLVWWQQLLLQLGLLVGLMSIERGWRGLVVQQHLETALRWGWRVVLPLAVFALLVQALG